MIKTTMNFLWNRFHEKNTLLISRRVNEKWFHEISNMQQILISRKNFLKQTKINFTKNTKNCIIIWHYEKTAVLEIVQFISPVINLNLMFQSHKSKILTSEAWGYKGLKLNTKTMRDQINIKCTNKVNLIFIYDWFE